MRTKKIVAISLTFNSITSYISEFHFRQSENKYIVTGTTLKPEEAHDFKNQTAAKSMLIRINNPYNREYKVEGLTIKANKSVHQDKRLA